MTVGIKNKLTRLFLLNLLAGTTLSSIILGSLWVAGEYDRFQQESEALKSQFIAEQKDLLKREIDNVVEFIEFKKSQSVKHLKRDIRNRTYEAWQIAMSIYERNRGSKRQTEIKEMVKDALRPIRYNDGRGYFFAVSMDGVKQLYPVMPELEGQNLIDLQDSRETYAIREEIELIHQSGEGFIIDDWPKLNQDPNQVYPKISFVKSIKPLNWYIGTGDYFDDVDKTTQAEILDWIKSIRIGKDEYVFAGQWDGLSLSGPAVGKNMIDITDVSGVKIVQELIEAAKGGGGYVHYVMPKLEDKKSASKISYAAGIHDWQWYVGAGLYVDEIDQIIADQRNILKNQVKSKIAKIILLLMSLLILIFIVARLFSLKIEKNLTALILFFQKAEKESNRINPQDLTFTEFAALAKAANTMIDQRVKAENKLRESREEWRAIVDNSILGIYRVTAEGKLLFVNPRMAEIMGYQSPEEFMAQVRNITQLYVNPEDREQNLKAFFTRGFISDQQVHFKRKDGESIWIQANARIVKEEAGQSIIEGFILDITARVKFEAALKESEERYRSLVDMSPEAIFLHQNGIIVYINQQGAQLLGANNPQRIIGKPVLDFIHPDFREVVRKRTDKMYAERKQLSRMEQTYVRLDGTAIDVEATGKCIVYAGQIAGLSVIRDITAHKLAERQKQELEAKLQQAQKMESVGTLAGGIAHDFNNLLMGIQGRASMMIYDLETGHPHVESLREIEKYVRSATDLTKQLLGFARGGKYEVAPTDMNEIVSRSSDMFGRTHKEITIHRREQKDVWTVEVDRSQIEQVFLNLYVNAWQAMSGPGQLYLETCNVELNEPFAKSYAAKPGRYVQISVMDSGHGMDAETQMRIFDPFFTTKELGRGTGLGLASAYGIIKNHGGIITVSSEIGKGATFTIYLPTSDKKVSDEKGKAFEIVTGSGTVLLIDDESVILDLGREMLQRLGYQALVAENGDQGLHMFKEHQDIIALVILDMIMPDIGGGEVYDRLRAIDSNVKVLLSSGYSLDGQAQEILERGCNGFIQKPFNLGKLSRKIHALLNESSGEEKTLH